MHILSVQLKNIKSHGDTLLFFSPGINVLSGPNGAGKSTVFEAVGYALFGVDAQDFVTRADRFLAIGAKRGEVSVTFQAMDGEICRVTRTVGPAAKWLLAKAAGDDFEVEEHANIKETESRIAGLLGLDNGRSLAEQFKLVIGPFQNDFLGPFIIRQPTRRQEAFDEILGINTWRKTYSGTKELLGALKGKVQTLQADVEVRTEQVVVLPARQAELSEARAVETAKNGELTEQARQLEIVTTLLQTLDAEKAGLDRTLNELRQLEERIVAGREHVASQRLLVMQSESAAGIVAAARAGKECYDRSELLLKELRAEEQACQALEKTIAQLEKGAAEARLAIEIESRELQEMAQATELFAQGIAADDQRLSAGREILGKEETGLRGELARAEALATAYRELPLHQVGNALPYLRMALDRLTTLDTELTTKEALLAGEDEARKCVVQLPELERTLEELQGERSRGIGRRDSLLEGRDKLGEGLCPFFQEPCRNLDGQPVHTIYHDRLALLDSEIARLDSAISAVVTRVEEVRRAENVLAGYDQIRSELTRLRRERTQAEEEYGRRLQAIDPSGLSRALEEWFSRAGSSGLLPEERLLSGFVPAQAPAERRAGLENWAAECERIIAHLDGAVTSLVMSAQEPLKSLEKTLTELTIRGEQLARQINELAERRERMGQRKSVIDSLSRQLAARSDELADRLQEHSRYAGLAERFALAQQEMTAHQADRDRYIVNFNDASEVEKRRETLRKYGDRLARLEQEKLAGALVLDRLQAAYQPGRHEQAKGERDILVAGVATLKADLVNMGETIRRLDGEVLLLQALREEIARKMAVIGALQEQEELVKFLRNQVFNKVSSQLSERFREEISLRADAIYRTIAETDEELYWGEQYQIVLRDMVEGELRERTDDQLSGGQIMSAVVALRLALLQTIGARIAFFDEPTSNLDAGRRENLARAFRAIDVGKEEVTEHWYDQLFLISHDVAFSEITDKVIDLEGVRHR